MSFYIKLITEFSEAVQLMIYLCFIKFCVIVCVCMYMCVFELCCIGTFIKFGFFFFIKT